MKRCATPLGVPLINVEADITSAMRNVRYWPLADIADRTAHVRFWG